MNDFYPYGYKITLSLVASAISFKFKAFKKCFQI